MKKLFIAVAAIAAAVACNTAEIVDLPSNPAISFENAFVENASRAAVDPSTTTASIDAFDVWAFMDETTGTVLVDETVSKVNGKWSYTNVQYWAPGHEYYFGALAPANSANWSLDTTSADKTGAGLVTFTNVDGSEDLLYASTHVSTADLKLGESMEAVKLTFSHLLSKVKFTFTNGFATDNVTINVKNVTMSAVSKATLALNGEWWNGDNWAIAENGLTLAFGDVEKLAAGAKAEAAAERLTIPTAADYVYNIKFYVDVYFGTVKAIEDHEFTSALTGAAFKMGKAYNLAATINAENLGMPVIEFDVIEVKEWENQTINGGVIGDVIKVVSTIEELQAALDAATGDTAIAIGADLQGNVTVPELKGATIAINGNGNKFDGTFALVGNSWYDNGTTLFENINFETAGLNGYDSFIYCNEQNGNTRYPDNVTVKDCTFKGTENTVALKFRSLKGNLLVQNVTVEGHSLLQLTSCGEANVIVDGATVNAGRGMSLGSTGNTVIRNSNIVAESYGVRADGCVANTTIENTTIEAYQPVVVRKVTVDGYVLNVDEASVLTTAEPYQIVFTKGQDDAEYVAPTAAFTCNAPATTIVFPTVQNAALVANDTEFAEAIANGATSIVLGEGEFYVPKAAKGKTLAIYGTGASTIKVASVQSEGLDYNFEGTTAVLNNLTISTVNGNYKGYARPASLTFNDCVFTNTYNLYGPEQIFNNCTFNVSGDKYNVWTWGGVAATFTGCTFNCDGKSLLLYGQVNTVLTVNDCVFNDNGTISGKAAIEIGNDYNKSYQLIVNSTIVNGFDVNPNGISTETTLWANKNSMSKEKLNVVVDGVDVY